MHILNNNLVLRFWSLVIACKSDPVFMSEHTLLTHFLVISSLVFLFFSMKSRLDECKSLPEHNFQVKFYNFA